MSELISVSKITGTREEKWCQEFNMKSSIIPQKSIHSEPVILPCAPMLDFGLRKMLGMWHS